MNITYRKADTNDLHQLKKLAIASWSQFRDPLTPENWSQLFDSLSNNNTYTELLAISDCLIAENEQNKIIGMIFLVPSGNPTDIYQADWYYLRFLSVDPTYRGKQIGKMLTKKCIEIAKENNEQTMALHTSELMNDARHIYEKIGFKILREIEPRLGFRYWLYAADLHAIS